MKYTVKNFKFSVDYKMAENEHGLFDGNIDEISVDLDKAEFIACYDTIKSIVRDAINGMKEVRQSELQSQNNNHQQRPYKWGKRDKEVFTKK